ncbi:MAG: hypothetical protein NTW50_04550 [Candidatus Berkelbacteria bacterium]|nr:hypothetical protein [Candidatus Berkelbacteria bacterium]
MSKRADWLGRIKTALYFLHEYHIEVREKDGPGRVYPALGGSTLKYSAVRDFLFRTGAIKQCFGRFDRRRRNSKNGGRLIAICQKQNLRYYWNHNVYDIDPDVIDRISQWIASDHALDLVSREVDGKVRLEPSDQATAVPDFSLYETI